MTEPPRRRPFRGARWRAARGGVRHHPAPVPCRVLDQNEDDVPGRMGVEIPIRVPHHPRDQGGVDVRELMRKTLRYMINRGAFVVGIHHLQRAGPAGLPLLLPRAASPRVGYWGTAGRARPRSRQICVHRPGPPRPRPGKDHPDMMGVRRPVSHYGRCATDGESCCSRRPLALSDRPGARPVAGRAAGTAPAVTVL